MKTSFNPKGKLRLVLFITLCAVLLGCAVFLCFNLFNDKTTAENSANQTEITRPELSATATAYSWDANYYLNKWSGETLSATMYVGTNIRFYFKATDSYYPTINFSASNSFITRLDTGMDTNGNTREYWAIYRAEQPGSVQVSLGESSGGVTQQHYFSLTIVQRPAQSTPTITPSASSVTVGGSITLTASGGNAGEYYWSVSDGTKATLSATTGTSVTLTGKAMGGVTVSLYRGASGNYSQSATVTTTISVMATQSTPTITPSASSVAVGSSITLTASGGNAGTYYWSVSDGTKATLSATSGASVTLTGKAMGAVTVYLYRGTSGYYLQSSSVSTTISVMGGQSAPTITPSATSVVVGNTITLTASGGNAGTYYWTVSDGTKATLNTTTGTSVTLTGKAMGGVTVSLYRGASGYYLQSATVSTTISVMGTQSAPTITPSASLVAVGETITLTASGGNAGTYCWSVNDGTKATLSATTGTNVTLTGKAIDGVTVSLYRGASGYYLQSPTVTVTINIEPGTPKVTPTLADGTYYIGRPLSEVPVPTNSASGGTAGTFTWDTPTAVVNSTSYTANWTFTPDDTVNYTELQGSITVPAVYEMDSITVVAGKTQFTAFDTFDISVLTVTAHYVDREDTLEIDIDACTVTTPYGEDGRTYFTVADNEKYITVSYTENGITKSATVQIFVSPKVLTGITFGDKTVTYNGSTQTIEIAGELPDDVTVKYLVAGSSNVYGGRVNAGSDRVTAKFISSSGNYTLDDITATLKVEPKTIEDSNVTGIAETYEYTGKTQQPLPTVKVTLAGGLTTLVKGGDYTVKFSSEAFAVDTVITVTIEGTGNFTGTVTRTFTIVKATLGFEWSGEEEEYVYNGEGQGPTATLTGVAENDGEKVVAVITYTGRGETVYNSTEKPAGAGFYTVTLSLSGDLSDYNEFDPQSVDFEILKATPTVTAGYLSYNPATDKLYDGGKLPDLELLSATYPGGEVAGTVRWVLGSALMTGTNVYTWEFIPEDSANFNVYTDTRVLTAVPPVIVGLEVRWVGGTQPTIFTSTSLESVKQYLFVTATLDDGTVMEDMRTYQLSGSWGASDKPSKAGTFTITVTRDGNEAEISAVYTAVVPDYLMYEQGYKKEYKAFEKFDTSTLVVKVVFNDKSEKIIPYGEGGYSVIYFNAGADYLCAGNSYITLSYEINGVTKTTQVGGLSVSKVAFDMTGITLTGNTSDWDGEEKSLTVSNADKFTVGTITYVYEKKNEDGTFTVLEGVYAVSDAGVYHVTAKFTLSDGVNKLNYYAIEEQEAFLTINKVDYDTESMSFTDKRVPYNNGLTVEHGLTVTNVPDGVTVTYIWKNAKGAVIDESQIINAGEYTVTAKFTVDGNHNAIEDMQAKLTVEKANPVTSPTVDGELLVGKTLSGLRFVAGENDTLGTYAWDESRNGLETKLILGTNTFYYTFTPNDTENYNTVTRTIQVIVRQKMLVSIDVSVNQNGVDLFSSYTLEDFTALISDGFESGKIHLEVYATFRDGQSESFEEQIFFGDYEIYLLNDAQTLTAGRCRFGVRYSFEGAAPKTYERCAVTVQSVELGKVTAEFTQNGEKIFTSSTIEYLEELLGNNKVQLDITGEYNDGRECKDTALLGSYTLSGDWSGLTADGTYYVTLTVNGTSVSTTFPITVTKVIPVEVTAEYRQNGQKIYTSYGIEQFKQKVESGAVTLTVTLHFNDGTEETLTLDEGYTLSIEGERFAVGDTVTVTYSWAGGTLSCTVEPEVTLVLVESVSAVLKNPASLVYTDTTFEELRGKITVTAHFNNGDFAETEEYALSLQSGATKLPQGAQISVTVSFTGADKTENCAGFDLKIGVTKHSTTITYDGTQYAYNGEEQTISSGAILNHSQEAAVTYTIGGNPATFKDVPAGGVLILTVTVEESEDYFGQTSNFAVTVRKAPLTVTANNASVIFGDAPANGGVEYEGFLGEDTPEDLQGEVVYNYFYAQNGNVGDYAITVSGLNSDNYEITFKAGTLSVGKKQVTVKWTNGEGLVYNGSAQLPEASFEDIFGSISDMVVTVTDENGNTVNSVNAAKYTAVATVNNPNYEFLQAEYEYEIHPAKIKVSMSGDQWFDEQGLFTGDTVLISLDGKDESGAYKYITLVGSQSGIEISYSCGYAIGVGTIPSPADETDWRQYKPDNIIEAGRYIVNYRISAPNHEDYLGQWKVEIVDPEDVSSKYVIIIFEKSVQLTYGAVPGSQEELDALAAMLINEGYVTVSGGITKERLAEVATLRLAIDNDNRVDGLTSVGYYTPYFEFKEEFAEAYESYTVFYKNENSSENTNIGKVIIVKRVVSVSWSSTSFEYNGKEQIPAVTVTDVLSGSTAQIVLSVNRTEYEVTLDGRLIKLNIVFSGDTAEVGGYSITVGSGNANFEVSNPFCTVSITPVDDGKIGVAPMWLWIGIGAGVLALIIILTLVIVLKRRKPAVDVDEDGFYEDYEGDE